MTATPRCRIRTARTEIHTAPRRLLSWAAFFLCLLALPVSSEPLRNVLAGVDSPYLAMHADDPVAWQVWSEDTLERARAEGRLILVSSGFFACHWCHVLQQESFRDPDFARLLNAGFMPIKVDREAEPALDAELRRAMQAVSGRAGWPLNLVLTPDGDPLYGFVYAPRPELLERLGRLHGLWQNETDRLASLARAASHELRPVPSPSEPMPPATAHALLRDALLAEIDPLSGGFGHGARFPHAPRLLAMLDLIEHQPEEAMEEALLATLEAMAAGGLRDQIGGGFFRYTVDPDWQQPHFEQMLVDQALLARVYLRAGRLLARMDMETVGRELIGVILRDFAHPEGGYVAAISALDHAGREGGGYLWTEPELAAVLDGQQLAAASHWLWVRHEGWGEGRLPVRIGHGDADRSAAEALLAARPRPVHPRDGQVPLAANGQLLTTLAEACRQRHAPACAAGESLAKYLRALPFDAVHELQGGVSLAEGLARWGEARGNESDLKQARQILEATATVFGSARGWRLSRRPLPAWSGRTTALADDEYPSASARWVALAAELDVTSGPRSVMGNEADAAPLRHATALARQATRAGPARE